MASGRRARNSRAQPRACGRCRHRRPRHLDHGVL